MRVLFVCLGNICRSPTAEVVLRTLGASEAPELQFEVDSAGTGDYHLGAPPDPRTQEAAGRRGYDLSALRARQLEQADFERFDLLLAMDEKNLADLLAAAPARHRERVRLFMDYAGVDAGTDVPDPYYGPPSGFELVLDLTERAARGLLAAMRSGAVRT